MNNWKRYHFSLGDSGKGPAGYCASVYARSEDEAVALMKETICETYEVGNHHDDPRIDYVNFYTNVDAISAKDIDDVEEVNEETSKRLDEALKAREERA